MDDIGSVPHRKIEISPAADPVVVTPTEPQRPDEMSDPPSTVPALPELAEPQAITVDPSQFSSVTKFEIFILMTMKLALALAQRTPILEGVLRSHGLDIAGAEGIAATVRATLGDETSLSENLKMLLNGSCRSAGGGAFQSELWPHFDFHVPTDEHGRRESARYQHNRASELPWTAPSYLPMWSTDIDVFARRFGPLTVGRRWRLDDEYLPMYEEHVFTWNGESYGAGFSWGIFMHASRVWE